MACDCAPPSLGLYVWLGLTEEFHIQEREKERICLCLFDGLEPDWIAHFFVLVSDLPGKAGSATDIFPRFTPSCINIGHT